MRRFAPKALPAAWRLAQLLVVASCCASASACGGAQIPNTNAATSVPSCARKPTKLPAPYRAEGRLLASGGQAMALCRYEPQKLGLALTGSNAITSRSRIARITAELDSLPRQPPGAYSCPPERGASVLVVAHFPGGHRSDVAVGLEGCQIVSNGVSGRWAENEGGRRLIAQLRTLTRNLDR